MTSIQTTQPLTPLSPAWNSNDKRWHEIDAHIDQVFDIYRREFNDLYKNMGLTDQNLDRLKILLKDFAHKTVNAAENPDDAQTMGAAQKAIDAIHNELGDAGLIAASILYSGFGHGPERDKKTLNGCVGVAFYLLGAEVWHRKFPDITPETREKIFKDAEIYFQDHGGYTAEKLIKKMEEVNRKYKRELEPKHTTHFEYDVDGIWDKIFNGIQQWMHKLFSFTNEKSQALPHDLHHSSMTKIIDVMGGAAARGSYALPRGAWRMAIGRGA